MKKECCDFSVSHAPNYPVSHAPNDAVSHAPYIQSPSRSKRNPRMAIQERSSKKAARPIVQLFEDLACTVARDGRAAHAERRHLRGVRACRAQPHGAAVPPAPPSSAAGPAPARRAANLAESRNLPESPGRSASRRSSGSLVLIVLLCPNRIRNRGRRSPGENREGTTRMVFMGQTEVVATLHLDFHFSRPVMDFRPCRNLHLGRFRAAVVPEIPDTQRFFFSGP